MQESMRGNMKTLNQLFISQFEPLLATKGFKRKRNAFHRLHGEKIIQLLSIRKFQDSFTIQYELIPICSGEGIEFPLDESRIGELVGNEALLEWDIDDNLEQSLLEAHDKCEKLLYDWFDYVKDYRAYYDFVMYRHEKSLSLLSEERKLEIAKTMKFPWSVGLYEVFLCLGEYEKAVAVLQQLLDQKISAMETNKKYGYQPTEQSLNEQKELICKIDKTREFQKGICSPDKMLKENEEKTLDSYLKNFCMFRGRLLC